MNLDTAVGVHGDISADCSTEAIGYLTKAKKVKG